LSMNSMPVISRCALEGFARAIEFLRERAIENVIDERGFSGAGDSGDDGEQTEGNRDVDIFQVVGGGAKDLNIFAVGGAARIGNGNF